MERIIDMMNFKKVCMAAVMTAVTLAGGSTVNGQELKSGEQKPVGKVM